MSHAGESPKLPPSETPAPPKKPNVFVRTGQFVARATRFTYKTAKFTVFAVGGTLHFNIRFKRKRRLQGCSNNIFELLNYFPQRSRIPTDSLKLLYADYLIAAYTVVNFYYRVKQRRQQLGSDLDDGSVTLTVR